MIGSQTSTGLQAREGVIEPSTLDLSVEGHIATVTLHDPATGNTVSPRMRTDLCAVWERVRADDKVRVVVIRASGTHFSAGHDGNDGGGAWPKRNAVWTPVVAAIQGTVCGAALSCIADADVVIASPEAVLGSIPPLSACESRSLGLVHDVVSADLLWARADAIARWIAERPAREMKAGVRAAWNLSLAARIQSVVTPAERHTRAVP